MKAILINRSLSPEEIAHVSSCEGCDVFVRTGLADPSQGKFSFTYRDISDEEKTRINFQVMDDLLAFAVRKSEGSYHWEHLSFEKANVWQYHKFRLYFQTRNLYFLIRDLELLGESYDNVDFYSSNGIFSRLALLPENVQLLHRPAPKAPRNYRALLSYAFVGGYRWFLGWFIKGRLKGRKHLILARPDNEHAMVDLETLEVGPGNIYLEYFINRTDSKEFAVMEELVTPKLKGKEPFPAKGRYFRTSKKRKAAFAEHYFLGGMLSGKLRKQVKAGKNLISERIKLIESHTGDLFGQVVLDHLKSIHNASFLYLARYYAYRRFFKKQGYQTVTLVDENTPLMKSVVDAAKAEGVKTVALQHGTMHPLHPAYRFSQEEISGQPQPDLTLTWGEYWENLLMEYGNYPKERLGVSGQVRTDVIPTLGALQPSQIIPGLSDSHPVLVYASQPQRDPEIRDRCNLDVFKAAAHFPDLQVLVKLHPREKDLDYFHRLAKQAGCTNYHLVEKADLYQVISICDVLITSFSTVGTETIYFRKPLLLIDHLRQDIQGYFKEGVAFQAANAEELQSHIKGILAGELKIEESAYQSYIEKYAYRIDGKAATRCIEQIISL